MIYLVIGIIIFIATHSLRIFADDWRSQMVTRLGVLPWKGLNSVVTIAGIAFIAYGYGIARQAPIVLWSPPIWISHLVSLLMLVSIVATVSQTPAALFNSQRLIQTRGQFCVPSAEAALAGCTRDCEASIKIKYGRPASGALALERLCRKIE